VDAPTATRKRLILATLCIALFMAMLDNVVVSNALPRISADLGAGISGLQWVMEGYSLVYAALLLASGALGDRLGRRGVFLVGLALFTGGSAVCATATGLSMLIVGRAIQGVGAAALTPQTLAILRTTFTDAAERGRAIGIWSGVSALGLALGPAIGGPLVSAFGWPSAFWINVPVGVLGLVLAFLVVPSTARARGRFDVAGQLAGSLGLATLVYGLVEGPVRGWTATPVLSSFALAVALLLAFVPLELAADTPVLDVRLLRDRVFAGAAFSGFVISFGMFGVFAYTGLYFQDVLGWSPAGAGIASLPATGVIMLTSPVASRLALRFGSRPPLVAGLLCCAIATGSLSAYGVGASYVDFWWVMPLIGVGMGLSFVPISIAVMNRVPIARAGMASATTNASREIGGVAGIAVLGAALTARLGAVITPRLDHAGLPTNAARTIRQTITSGGAGGLAHADTLPSRVRLAVSTSFVDGLHLALWCAAAFLALGAVLVGVLMRPDGKRTRADGPSDARPETAAAPA
jgi:EmrB/QacA subfamily drug resistance transporter